jgi:hypothetical protein
MIKHAIYSLTPPSSPSFFNSTPPPVTPSRRFAFVQEDWDACGGGGDDEDDGAISLQLESPDDDCAMPWSKGTVVSVPVLM